MSKTIEADFRPGGELYDTREYRSELVSTYPELKTVEDFYRLLEGRTYLANVRIEVKHEQYNKHRPKPRKDSHLFELDQQSFMLNGEEYLRFVYRLFDNKIVSNSALKAIIGKETNDGDKSRKKILRPSDYYPIVGILTRLIVLKKYMPDIQVPLSEKRIGDMTQLELIGEAGCLYKEWLEMSRKKMQFKEWNWISLTK